jgi:predicted thioesterase
VPDLWTAPAGTPADLTVLPLLPIPAGAHVEQLIWHGAPVDAAEAPLRLTTVDDGPAGRVQTLRLLRGDLLVADLRLRHGPPRAPAPHHLLRTGLAPGASCTRAFTVTGDLTTDHVPGAEPVLSTPSLVACMEDTAADVLRPHFGPATASLGTWIGVRHTGPAHTGETFVVTATLADIRGRRYLFDVHAVVAKDPAVADAGRRAGDDRAALAGRAIGDGQVAQTLIAR